MHQMKWFKDLLKQANDINNSSLIKLSIEKKKQNKTKKKEMNFSLSRFYALILKTKKEKKRKGKNSVEIFSNLIRSIISYFNVKRLLR